MIKVTYIAPIGLRFCMRESFDEIYNLSPSDGPKRRKIKKSPKEKKKKVEKSTSKKCDYYTGFYMVFLALFTGVL